MSKKIFLTTILVAFLTQQAMAADLSLNALTYGLTSIPNAAKDPDYSSDKASTEFNLCMADAPSGGAANGCVTDESVKIRDDINSLMNHVSETPNLNNDDKKILINSVKTDLYRIDYLCNVFLIGADGKINDSYDGIANSYVDSCELSRLFVLKKFITDMITNS
ncbi:hypothetical protein [Serratia fonticola]|uniref:hypothetical protein n=1 Tax=Serratia fonticola TaxID=47917 RepID=UPI00301D025A